MNKSADILLSIAIPTKNRQAYLVCLVRELLKSGSQEFEVVIQDNSDDDGMMQFVSVINDSRLKYYYNAGPLSVVENCDAAIAECCGHYVCMLGDDDGVLLDEALELLKQYRLDGIDAVMSEVLHYVWPDLGHHVLRDYGGQLFTDPIKGTSQNTDLEAIIRRVVRHGGALGLEDLPCVYHGFVSREVLAALKEKSGSCFPGPSPDMANAVGLCAVLSSWTRTSRRLVITGHSGRSTAGAGTLHKHHGAIADQTHLPLNTASEWFASIPFFWSGPTIYSQSLFSALARTGNSTVAVPSMACVYAACLIYHRKFAAATFAALRSAEEERLGLYLMIAFYMGKIAFQRARSLVKNLRNQRNGKKMRAIRAETIAEAIGAARTLNLVEAR